MPAGRPSSLRAIFGVFVAFIVLLWCSACGSAVDPPLSASSPSSSSPSSPSTSSSESPAVWTGVALGDSVTSGYGCGCTPFPARYAKAVEQRYGVPLTMHNVGVAGLTSDQLLASLTRSGSDDSRLVRAADIDLITIGANDFGDDHDAVTSGTCAPAGDADCAADELQQLTTNLDAIIAAIHRLRAGRPTAILITGYWNVFEDGDVARSSFPEVGRAAAKRLTAEVNRTIASAARASGAAYVDLAGPFASTSPDGDPTDLLAADGDHPNAAGHTLIAESLMAAGLPGLR